MAARFHCTLEERTQARYDAAKENNYIEYVGKRMIGHELEQVAHEEDPIRVVRALEREGWLQDPASALDRSRRLSPAKWASSRRPRQMMNDLGYFLETGPIVMYFLTKRMSDKDALTSSG